MKTERVVRLVTAFVLTCCTCLPLLAADTPKPSELPPAQQIVDRFVKESGGREAILKHSAQYSKGTIEIPAQGIKGTIEIFSATPAKLIIKVTMPEIGEMITGYDGKVGYTMNAVTGPVLTKGKALERLKEQADLHAILHEPAKYKALETVERTTYEGKECYKVRFVKTNGDETFEFFDIKTGLMTGMIAEQDSPVGPMKVTSAVEEYKKFDGVLIGTKISQLMGSVKQVIDLQTVQFDSIPASTFDLPAEIKALNSK